MSCSSSTNRQAKKDARRSLGPFSEKCFCTDPIRGIEVIKRSVYLVAFGQLGELLTYFYPFTARKNIEKKNTRDSAWRRYKIAGKKRQKLPRTLNGHGRAGILVRLQVLGCDIFTDQIWPIVATFVPCFGHSYTLSRPLLTWPIRPVWDNGRCDDDDTRPVATSFGWICH